MIEKADLERAFAAWYDHKMDPEDPELLRVHRATLDGVRETMEKLLNTPLDRQRVRKALGPRFGQWMIENGLPRPPKS